MKTIILSILFCIVFRGYGFGQEEPSLPDSVCMAWWNGLDDEWQRYFMEKDSLTKPIDAADFDSIRRKTTSIDLHEYVIYDLNPLRALSGQLQVIDCSRSPLLSLEPLRGMNNLITFICDSVSSLRSIEPIIALPKLVAVKLIKTQIPSDELKKLRARKEVTLQFK